MIDRDQGHSNFEEVSYGSFDPWTFVVRLESSASDLEGQLIESMSDLHPNLATHATDEPDNDQLYRRLALLHEYRHFHDFFGTRLGIEIMESTFELAGQFLLESKKLRERDANWLEAIHSENGDHQTARHLVQRIGRFENVLKFVNGGRLPTYEEAAPGLNLDLAVEVTSPYGSSWLAFPSNFSASHRGDSHETMHILVPIGMRGVMEGTAQAVQRSTVAAAGGQSEGIMQRLVVVEEDSPDNRGRAYGVAPPYDITDFMISRHLRGLGDEASFERDTVLALSDKALTASVCQFDSNTGRHIYSDPGRVFHDILLASDRLSLQSGDPQVEPQETDYYSGLLETIENNPKWTDVIDEGIDPLDGDEVETFQSLDVLRTYIGHEVVAPLLRHRLDTDHRSFRSFDDWVDMWLSLGSPPFVSLPGSGLVFDEDRIPLLVIRAWTTYVFVLHLMRQLGRMGASDHGKFGLLLCPRAEDKHELMRQARLTRVGTCTESLRIGRCGYGRLGSEVDLPDCLFKAAATEFALFS